MGRRRRGLAEPFFWSSAGYGVLRSTFAPGIYDFGSSGDAVVAEHEDPVFDAYVFLAAPGSLRATAQSILGGLLQGDGRARPSPRLCLLPGASQRLQSRCLVVRARGRRAGLGGPRLGAGGCPGRHALRAGSAPRLCGAGGPSRGVAQRAGRGSACLGRGLPRADPVRVLRPRRHRRARPPRHALGWILPNDGYGAATATTATSTRAGWTRPGRARPSASRP